MSKSVKMKEVKDQFERSSAEAPTNPSSKNLNIGEKIIVSSSAEWAVVFATSTAPFMCVIDNEIVRFTHDFIIKIWS